MAGPRGEGCARRREPPGQSRERPWPEVTVFHGRTLPPYCLDAVSSREFNSSSVGPRGWSLASRMLFGPWLLRRRWSILGPFKPRFYFFPFHPLSAPLPCACVFHARPFTSLRTRSVTRSWCRVEEGRPALSCTCCDLVSLTNQDVGKAAPWEVSLRRRERGLPGACLVLVPHRGDPAVKWGGGSPHPLKSEELPGSQQVRAVGSLPFVPFWPGGSLPRLEMKLPELDPLSPPCRFHRL